MEYCKLVPDMYRVILDYLDFSTKLNYIEFLETTLTYKITLTLKNPDDQDVLNIYSGNHIIEDIKLLLKHLENPNNLDKYIDIYIKNFSNCVLFGKLIGLPGKLKNRGYSVYRQCFIYKNYNLFKYLHDTYGHQRVIYPGEKFPFDYDLFDHDDLSGNIKCYECEQEYYEFL